MNARLYDSKPARRGPRQGPPRERAPPLLRPPSADPGVGALPTMPLYEGLALGPPRRIHVNVKAEGSHPAATPTQAAMPHSSNTKARERRRHRRRIVLAIDPGLTEPELLTLYHAAAGDRVPFDFLAALVAHPSAGSMLLSTIVRTLCRDDRAGWDVLATARAAQQDPEVRQHVVLHAGVDGLKVLAPFCSRDDWRQIFRRVADPANPVLTASAQYILALATPDQLEGITRADWVRAALQRVSMPGLDLIAYVPDAWCDPRVRDRLAEFCDPAAVPGILAHTDDEQLARRLFWRLRTANPRAAAILVRDRPEATAKLWRADLAPLLASKDAVVREAAFDAVRHLGPKRAHHHEDVG